MTEISLEAEEVFYLYDYATKIYRELNGKSLFEDAVECFVHAVTILQHKHFVSAPRVNRVEKGLLFSAYAIPAFKLDTAKYDEALTMDYATKNVKETN